jgi:ElaB/YqjD/DUF883 family membrane-anchored ribosome-binding protein
MGDNDITTGSDHFTTGGSTGAGDSGTQATQDRTFTQDDINRIVTNRHKALVKELESRPTQEQYIQLQQKLDELLEAKELEGKSEQEKIRHQYNRDLEKLQAKLSQYDEQMKAKDSAVVQMQEQLKKEQDILQRERLSRAFSAALQKAEVVSIGANDALMVLLNEIRDSDISDRGVRASYGKDLIDEAPEAIAKKFLQDHPHYASVRGGGAGTTLPNGQPLPRNLDDLTQDELFELAGPFPKS